MTDSLLELTRRLVHAFATSSSTDEMFATVVDALVAEIGIDRAALLTLDEASGRMRFRAWRGLSDAFRADSSDRCPWQPDSSEPAPLLIDDVDTAPTFEDADALRREGIRALAYLPLVHQNRLLGKLVLYAAEPTRWTDEPIRFASFIADLLSSICAREEAHRELHESDTTLRMLARYSPTGILLEDTRGTIVFTNQRFSELFDLPPSHELVGRPCLDVAREVSCFADPTGFVAQCKQLITSDAPRVGLPIAMTDDRTYEQGFVPIGDGDGLFRRLWTYADVTERLRFQEQLGHIQKMESLGSLCGSVAHDFNNLLTSISGYAELIRADLPTATATIRYVDELVKIVDSAADLAGQLLHVARPPAPKLTTFDLRQFVLDAKHMLERLVGPTIDLAVDEGLDLPPIRADRTQIHQVLMNLVVNARDAMPGGGEIRVRFALANAARGPEVALSIQDNGVGMDTETLGRAFEPLFTTKEPGHGTGLGLSTCFGIVQRFGGRIELRSAPGLGTSAIVYLPAAVHSKTAADGSAPGDRNAAHDNEPGETLETTLLLVDDEPSIRDVLGNGLRARGFQVLLAEDGDTALELLSNYDVQAVVSDVLMPGMSGIELYRRVRAVDPDVVFVLVSGGSVLPERVPADVPFLPKPLLARDIARRVVQELAGRRVPGQG